MGIQIKIWYSVMKRDVDFIHVRCRGLKACLLHIVGDNKLIEKKISMVLLDIIMKILLIISHVI